MKKNILEGRIFRYHEGKIQCVLNFGNHKYNVSIIKSKMPSIYCSFDKEKHNIWMAKIVKKMKKAVDILYTSMVR